MMIGFPGALELKLSCMGSFWIHVTEQMRAKRAEKLVFLRYVARFYFTMFYLFSFYIQKY